MGQKRKEKRLSALEELTCTYSIEEMKMPKIIDTGQPHPLRTTNISNLSIASNNNLKETNHHQHRGNNVGVGGTIVTTTNSISTNNNSTNNNNSNTVYTMPVASIPDIETEKWVGDPYRQQQEQLSGNTNNISIGINSKANQISNSQHLNHVIQSNHSASSVISISNTPIPGAVNTVSCIVEEDNEKLSIGAVVPHIDLSGNINESNSSGITSQNTINIPSQPKSDIAEYVSIKGTKQNDAAAVSNRLCVMLSSSSSSKINVSIYIIFLINTFICYFSTEAEKFGKQ